MGKALDLSSMSRMEARVAVMRDVVKRMRYVQYAHKAYCTATNLDFKPQSGTELQTVIRKMEKNCRVCALGGMFLSHVRLFDAVKAGTGNEWEWLDTEWNVPADVVKESLGKYFSKEELTTIEFIYELGRGMLEYPDATTRSLCWGFMRKVPVSTDRIRRVAQHIIRNDGEFDLDELVKRIRVKSTRSE